MKGQEQENLLSKQNGHDPSQPSLKLKVKSAHGGIQVVPPTPQQSSEASHSAAPGAMPP